MNVESVFRRHHDELFRYLARECGDPHLARDAVQEAFLRLHQQRDAVAAATVRSWLFTTGMNVLRDTYRTRTTQRRILETRAARVPAPRPDPDPAQELERRQDRERLRAALDALRERERTALLMREEGFKHREIAEALQTTTGSVGTLISRALSKLARALDDQGFTP